MERLKNDLKQYVLELIIERLEQYEGISEYACDIAYKIFEGDNANGSITFSTYEARQWIGTYFEDIGEVVEELKFQFGGLNCIPNLFENPEAFMVCIVIEVSQYMLSQCDLIDQNWNDEITLSNKNIELLKKQLIEKNNTYNVYE